MNLHNKCVDIFFFYPFHAYFSLQAQLLCGLSSRNRLKTLQFTDFFFPNA